VGFLGRIQKLKGVTVNQRIFNKAHVYKKIKDLKEKRSCKT
jgi:hypothetical protein